jgi:hypothetical protein
MSKFHEHVNDSNADESYGDENEQVLSVRLPEIVVHYDLEVSQTDKLPKKNMRLIDAVARS